MNTALEKIALSIRSLSMDAIQKANSGHPGLPLGAAELAAVLYGSILKHNPANPSWQDRDRFILSAGHGSMLLYSILHISGYNVTLDDIRSFRQIGSRCPGHPEYGDTDGVEITTGPLGQGVSAAVGMAIAETMDASRYNTPDFTIADHYTYALVGEGCLMEGVSSEASSLAGHLKLGKLIVFYDENRICIDGPTDMTFSEDIGGRYTAYGWQVLSGDMYDMAGIEKLVAEAKKDSRPSLIMLKSVIGKGAASVAGTAKAHGAPIGPDGIAEAKKALGLDPSKDFFVAPEAYEWCASRRSELAALEAEWNKTFKEWSARYPDKRALWDASRASGGVDPAALNKAVLPEFKQGENIATRTASNTVLNAFASVVPTLVGGSADLQGPNAVAIKGAVPYSPEARDGRYIHYGVREFAMAAITNGIQVHGGYRAFCATFLIFSDYLRPALRLSALMNVPAIYVLTHDSIFVGEDGPTHQPIETLASLRAIPNVRVFRPADAEETVYAWKMALARTDGPVCLALTRQNLPVFAKDDPDWKHTIECGAYVVRKGGQKPDMTILATGSEVSLALEAAGKVSGKNIRIVSVVSRELFESQPEEIQNAILGGSPDTLRIVTAEAGVRNGWERWASSVADCFSIDRFGESGPANTLAEHLGFTADTLAGILQK
ncbi:MAG TPA: transketolase [Treponemataceae bacterium]|jgi:transketolase|nr:MAG: Transketolase [Spirochaetes bacterium ADurb.Bin269]HOC28055.1 transketolase [Treponemataceae bacterium]HPX46781.1 transketolase [Treponemataceae bacterium]HQL31731.1 transketolase [Treponemataceae bacterium]